MIQHKQNNRGLIKAIVLILIVLLILAYFQVNLRNVVSSDAWRDNWEFVKSILVWIWENILEVPLTYLWGKVSQS